MNQLGFPILSLMLGIPLLAGFWCLFVNAQMARRIALAATLVDLVMGIVIWAAFVPGGPQWQFQESIPLFAPWFSYALGIDGIALMLIVLTVFLMPMCIAASWTSIEKRVPEYMAAFLFDVQEAAMHIGIRKTVSTISISAMPSMPSA